MSRPRVPSYYAFSAPRVLKPRPNFSDLHGEGVLRTVNILESRSSPTGVSTAAARAAADNTALVPACLPWVLHWSEEARRFPPLP